MASTDTLKISFWRAVVRQALQLDFTKMNPLIAARNTLGIALALALGLETGSAVAALTCSLGAMLAAYSDGEDAYYVRGRRMLWCTLVCALAVFAGLLTGGRILLTNSIVVAAAFVTGFAVLFGQTVSDLCLFSLVMFLTYSTQSQSLGQAFHTAGFALFGGLLQTSLSLLAWPFEPDRPERKALALLYQNLAEISLQDSDPSQSPPVSAATTQVQLALSSLGRFEGESVERSRSLLSQGERLRLSLLSLQRLRRRLQRQTGSENVVQILVASLQNAQTVLLATSKHLSEQKSLNVAAELAQLDQFVQTCRSAAEETKAEDFSRAVFKDLSRHLVALAGQLRTIVHLVTDAPPARMQAAVVERPWMFKLRSGLAMARANLSRHSVAFRHALRLALCVAIGETLCRVVHVQRAQWLPMTVVIVLKPDLSGTLVRGLLRMGGTLLGLLLATALYQWLEPTLTMNLVLLVSCMFFLRWLGPVNYGLFAVAVSALVVAVIAMTGIRPSDVIWARAFNTLLGGGLAMLAYLLWPTWEKNQVSQIVANLLRAYMDYFREVSQLLQDPAKASALKRENARIMGRIARSNFEASLGRLQLEPKTTPEELLLLKAFQASSNRFAHSTMALEAAGTAGLSAADVPEFAEFSQKIVVSMETLCQSLQGPSPQRRDFPPLRDFFEKWKEKSPARSSLVDEADLITNSLNTMREQLLKIVF